MKKKYNKSFFLIFPLLASIGIVFLINLPTNNRKNANSYKSENNRDTEVFYSSVGFQLGDNYEPILFQTSSNIEDIEINYIDSTSMEYKVNFSFDLLNIDLNLINNQISNDNSSNNILFTHNLLEYSFYFNLLLNINGNEDYIHIKANTELFDQFGYIYSDDNLIYKTYDIENNKGSYYFEINLEEDYLSLNVELSNGNNFVEGVDDTNPLASYLNDKFLFNYFVFNLPGTKTNKEIIDLSTEEFYKNHSILWYLFNGFTGNLEKPFYNHDDNYQKLEIDIKNNLWSSNGLENASFSDYGINFYDSEENLIQATEALSDNYIYFQLYGKSDKVINQTEIYQLYIPFLDVEYYVEDSIFETNEDMVEYDKQLNIFNVFNHLLKDERFDFSKLFDYQIKTNSSINIMVGEDIDSFVINNIYYDSEYYEKISTSTYKDQDIELKFINQEENKFRFEIEEKVSYDSNLINLDVQGYDQSIESEKISLDSYGKYVADGFNNIDNDFTINKTDDVEEILFSYLVTEEGINDLEFSIDDFSTREFSKEGIYVFSFLDSFNNKSLFFINYNFSSFIDWNTTEASTELIEASGLTMEELNNLNAQETLNLLDYYQIGKAEEEVDDGVEGWAIALIVILIVLIISGAVFYYFWSKAKLSKIRAEDVPKNKKNEPKEKIEKKSTKKLPSKKQTKTQEKKKTEKNTPKKT